MACLGHVLKKSLKDDKNKHVQSVVNAACVERASGDDRAFWKGVRALRNRGSGGARMIALENGDLALHRLQEGRGGNGISRSFFVVKSFPAMNALLLRGRITMSAKLWNLKRTLCPQ